jgi:hypothetical protein
MATARKPFSGVINIIRFNWPFYFFSVLILVILLLILNLYSAHYLYVAAFTVFSVSVIVSLVVSWYVYDYTALYDLNWLDPYISQNGTILNINAGFDETSGLLKQKYPNANIVPLDFYNPAKHTEASIKRARKAYPSPEGTLKIETSGMPFADNSADSILLIFSAHEIRDEEERHLFFSELKRIASSNTQVVITEHLRNWKNFLAYNIGFLHFHSRGSWLKTFEKSHFVLQKELRNNPFVTTFICSKK